MKGIHASGEEYLKWIMRIQQESGSVRNIDLARAMGYSKPSITLAVKQLIEQGYITKDNEGYIHFTESGSEIAYAFNERHRVLTHLLGLLGVEHSIATADACKLEHVISQESFDKIKELDRLKTKELSTL